MHCVHARVGSVHGHVTKSRACACPPDQERANVKENFPLSESDRGGFLLNVCVGDYRAPLPCAVHDGQTTSGDTVRFSTRWGVLAIDRCMRTPREEVVFEETLATTRAQGMLAAGVAMARGIRISGIHRTVKFTQRRTERCRPRGRRACWQHVRRCPNGHASVASIRQ